MREVNIKDSNFATSVTDVFLSDNPVILFEFSGTYGFVSPNSISGALALDRAKNRLAGKFYGSMLGDASAFRNLLPENLKSGYMDLIQTFEGSFIRFPVKGLSAENKVIKNNTHQVLIEKEYVRNSVAEIEQFMLKKNPVSDFFLQNYQALLCTSANMSGDAGGGIADLQKALDYSTSKNVKLCVHSGLMQDYTGSYPVFELLENTVSIARHGHMAEQILDRAMSKFYI